MKTPFTLGVSLVMESYLQVVVASRVLEASCKDPLLLVLVEKGLLEASKGLGV